MHELGSLEPGSPPPREHYAKYPRSEGESLVRGYELGLVMEDTEPSTICFNVDCLVYDIGQLCLKLSFIIGRKLKIISESHLFRPCYAT